MDYIHRAVTIYPKNTGLSVAIMTQDKPRSLFPIEEIGFQHVYKVIPHPQKTPFYTVQQYNPNYKHS
jgi:hypothetical protein